MRLSKSIFVSLFSHTFSFFLSAIKLKDSLINYVSKHSVFVLNNCIVWIHLKWLIWLKSWNQCKNYALKFNSNNWFFHLFFFSICKRSQITRLASGSIPEVGSSRRTTLELPIRATPKCTFRFIPPETKKQQLFEILRSFVLKLFASFWFSINICWFIYQKKSYTKPNIFTQ